MLAKDFLCGQYLFEPQVVVSFIVSDVQLMVRKLLSMNMMLCGRKSFHLAVATFSHHWQHLAAAGNPTHACRRQQVKHCATGFLTNCTVANQPPCVCLFLVFNLCRPVHAIDQQASHASPERPEECQWHFCIFCSSSPSVQILSLYQKLKMKIVEKTLVLKGSRFICFYAGSSIFHHPA